MEDPAGNKKKEVQKEIEGEEEELEEKYEEDYQNDIANSYNSLFQFSFTIFANARKKIEELGLNDQKEIDIEIRGSKKEPTGISFELINFDKTKNNEFYEDNVEYINEAFLIISLNLELKKEEDLSIIKIIYDKFKIFVHELPNDLFNIRTLFRKRGKKVSFDIIQNNENIKKDETSNSSTNNYLNIGIKTDINLKDIFSENPDHLKNLINSLFAIFKFKIKGMYTNYIILLILECIKITNLRNETLKLILENINEFLNLFIMSFCKSEIKLEYNPKNLANEIIKELCLLFGKNEEGEFQKIANKYLSQVKNIIKDELLIDNNLLSLIKKINIDCFSFSCLSSLIQYGFAFILKIPGFYDFITSI